MTYLKPFWALVLAVWPLQAMCFEPTLFGVINVPSGDTLNVRHGPSASTLDVGDLSNNDVIEVLEISSNGTWGRIIWGEGTGWVSMQYLQDTPRTAHLPIGLVCSGAEPFWSVAITQDKTVKFRNLGDETDVTQSIVIGSASGRIGAPYAFDAPNVSGVVRAQSCTDGMSDRTYGWAATVLLRGDDLRVFEGCCRTQLDR